MHKLMEFILPILSASGEAVIFVLIVIVLFVIGRGRILPSEKTLVIERPGQYSMVLAPGLNLAQPFIETIARQLSKVEMPVQESLRLHFEVRDKDVATRKRPAYLLAISWHNGILRFEALHAEGKIVADEDVLSSASEQARQVETTVRNLAASWGIGLNKPGSAAALL